MCENCLRDLRDSFSASPFCVYVSRHHFLTILPYPALSVRAGVTDKNAGQEIHSLLDITTSPSSSPFPRVTLHAALFPIILPVMYDLYMCLCCCSCWHKTKYTRERHFLWRGMFSHSVPSIIVAFLTFFCTSSFGIPLLVMYLVLS